MRSTTHPVVGVVGSGQLAQMLYQAAISLGVEVRVLAADAADSAARTAHDVTIGDWHDAATLRAFAALCDVVTFDHELVDPATVELLEEAGTVVRPGANTLRHAADKARTRALCDALRISTPPHVIATRAFEVAAGAEVFGYPMVAKLTRGGYDGRGVFRLADHAETTALFDRLPPETVVVVEPELTLIAELATQVVRRADGAMVHYPLVRTYQDDGVCRIVEAPADIDLAVARQAREWAANLAQAAGAVGVIAVEFFVTDRGLVVNELAPRPHNSGHYTIDACVTSQFENHLRAVLNLPLGATDMTAARAVMINLIAGRTGPCELDRLIADPYARVHLYRKDIRPGRKVGHVTICGTDRDALMVQALAIDGRVLIRATPAAARP